MNNALNIPLNSTRQLHWRVLQIGLTALGVLALGWIVFRGVVIGIPLRDAPKDSDFALYIPKTTASTRLAEDHFNGISAIPGGPWSITTLLHASTRGLIIAKKGDETTVILDTSSAELAHEAERFDIFATTNEDTTILSTSTTPGELVPTFSWMTPGLFRPSAVAVLASGNQTSIILYSRGKNRLTMPSAQLLASPTGGVGSPENELIIAAELPAAALADWSRANIPLTLPGLNALVGIAAESGLSAYVSRDSNKNISYLFNTKTSSASQEDAVAIGRDIVAMPTIIAEYTSNPDKSTRHELFAVEPAFTVRTEDGYTFTDVIAGTERARLTLGPSTLSVTNDFSAEALVTPPFSTPCAARSLALLRPKSLATTYEQHTFTTTSLWGSLWQLNEISQTNNGVRACWN